VKITSIEMTSFLVISVSLFPFLSLKVHNVHEYFYSAITSEYFYSAITNNTEAVIEHYTD